METFVGTEEYHLPIWQATYTPFGSIYEDFDSTGITVGNNANTKITWFVPFRFPGQYQDPELEGIFYYNWNRYYSPAIGRYNRADPLITIGFNNVYIYAANNPLLAIDFDGLKCTWGEWEQITTIGPEPEPELLYETTGYVFLYWKRNLTSTCTCFWGERKCGVYETVYETWWKRIGECCENGKEFKLKQKAVNETRKTTYRNLGVQPGVVKTRGELLGADPQKPWSGRCDCWRLSPRVDFNYETISTTDRSIVQTLPYP